ncbi:hypothetical protein BGZ96_008086 [Linnemannia gamsii]|uniref:BHLH domain-containing protein n=1 Tax=Linnemannia gamsii TaxID=64522 RepID=A0ABQ7JZB4_9FUNG|nr:hypothetical protein BGZ96_008086 [Linnemannia gamsii]
MASSTPPANTKNIFRLHGVNVLNKNDVDSITRLTALEKRRAAHIVDERQRRDTMNQLMAELGHLAEGSAAEVQAQLELEQSIPNPDGTEKRAIVKSNAITTLRNAIAEIHRLRSEVGLKRLASYKEVLVIIELSKLVILLYFFAQYATAAAKSASSPTASSSAHLPALV